MKKHAGWALASAMLVGNIGSAYAADMAVKAPRPVVPVCVWCGFYAGGNLGYAWGQANINAVEGVPTPPFFAIDAAAVNAASSPRLDPSGFTGGGQIGYNWQQGAAVYGLEADVEAFHLRASTTGTFPFPSTLPGGAVGPPTSFFTPTSSASTDWLLTGRGRIGWANDQWLVYATGGIAVTNASVNQTVALLTPFVWTVPASSTLVGWTLGAGIEWMASRNWSFKAEYLYLDFGNLSGVGTLTPAFTGFTFNNSTHLTASIVRAGVNYHFGGPVVAKY